MQKRIFLGALLPLALVACDSPYVMSPEAAAGPNLARGGVVPIVDEDAVPVLLGNGFSFTDGPATDHWGNVYFTDQPNDRIHRWDWKTGQITQFLSPTGRANGMAFDNDGNLIAAADMHGELWSIAPDGTVTVLVDNYQGKLLNGPNDVWIDPEGGIYFTDPLFVRNYWDATDPRRAPGGQQGGGFVYYLSPDHETLTRVSGADVIAETAPNRPVWPNGIVGTPDGKYLYVGYFEPQRIFRYEIGEDGRLSNRVLFARRGTDGMALDQLGNLYTTSRVRGTVVFNPEGETIDTILTGGTAGSSNVTFAGPNRKTLIITAGNSIYGVEMNVRGGKDD